MPNPITLAFAAAFTLFFAGTLFALIQQ